MFERKILSPIVFSGLSCSSVFAERGVQDGLIMDGWMAFYRLGKESRRLEAANVRGCSRSRVWLM